MAKGMNRGNREPKKTEIQEAGGRADFVDPVA